MRINKLIGLILLGAILTSVLAGIVMFYYPFDVKKSSKQAFPTSGYEDVWVEDHSKFNIIETDKYNSWLQFSPNTSFISLIVKDKDGTEKVISVSPNEKGTQSFDIYGEVLAKIGGVQDSPYEFTIYYLNLGSSEKVKLPKDYRLDPFPTRFPQIKVFQESIFLISVPDSKDFLDSKWAILRYDLRNKNFEVFTHGKPCVIGDGPWFARILYNDGYLHWQQGGEWCFFAGDYYKKRIR